MSLAKSNPGAHTWTYPLWFGEHCGGHIFGGSVVPSGESFVALFTTQARAERFIAADPDFDGEEKCAAELINEADMHEWLTELNSDGRKFVIFNPISITMPFDRAVSITDLLSRLTVPEAV